MLYEVTEQDIRTLAAQSEYELAMNATPYLPLSDVAHSRSPLQSIEDLYDELKDSMTDETLKKLEAAKQVLQENEIDKISKLSHAVHIVEVSVLALTIGHLAELLVELVPNFAHSVPSIVKGVALVMVFIFAKRL